MKTREFIRKTWLKAVRQPEPQGDFLLPAPFVPPCYKGAFLKLFYWDTYFTNKGLIADGYADLAKNNVDDLLYALDYFGCVPNYCSADGAEWCSQPPLLSLMVADVYAVTGDKKWLARAFEGLEKELSFWRRERMGKCGLFRHGTNQRDFEKLVEYYGYVSTRLDVPADLSAEQKAARAKIFIAQAESGMDFTARLENTDAAYCHLDLNCHLAGMEKNMSRFAAELGLAEKAAEYGKAYAGHVKLIDALCFADGVYTDYDENAARASGLIGSAGLLPYFYGFGKGGVKAALDKLEFRHGVVAFYKKAPYMYQWDYPNVWPPVQYFAAVAAENAGEKERARTIMKKYVDAVAGEFERSGGLWEKYSAETGACAAVNEYEITPMLGWTAGVYALFFDKLSR